MIKACLDKELLLKFQRTSSQLSTITLKYNLPNYQCTQTMQWLLINMETFTHGDQIFLKEQDLMMTCLMVSLSQRK